MQITYERVRLRAGPGCPGCPGLTLQWCERISGSDGGGAWWRAGRVWPLHVCAAGGGGAVAAEARDPSMRPSRRSAEMEPRAHSVTRHNPLASQRKKGKRGWPLPLARACN